MSNSFQLFFNCITKKYFQFKGRASRKEFWVFFIYSLILDFILVINGYIFKDNPSLSIILKKLPLFFGIFLIIPHLAVSTRRLHDLNFNGWWQLLPIILASFMIVTSNVDKLNYISTTFGILFTIMTLFKGTNGLNRYGDQPN